MADNYVIEVMPDGTCDVTNNGRSVAYDRDDLDEALRVVRDRGADKVTVVEPDGYRTTRPL